LFHDYYSHALINLGFGSSTTLAMLCFAFVVYSSAYIEQREALQNGSAAADDLLKTWAGRESRCFFRGKPHCWIEIAAYAASAGVGGDY